MLCGGTSRRMGRPKAFLRGPDGLTLLERTVALLHQAGCYPLAIAIAPGQPMPIWSSAPLVYPSPAVAIDHAPGLGPLAGIAAGLETLRPWCQRVCILPCDLPHLNLAAVQALLATAGDGAACVRQAGWANPLLAVYPSTLGERALELLRQGRPRADGLLAELSGLMQLEALETDCCWHDCDTAEDWDILQRGRDKLSGSRQTLTGGDG